MTDNDNMAENSGGAVLVLQASLSAVDVVMHGNEGFVGSAVIGFGPGTVVMMNSQVVSNVALAGPAVLMTSGINLTMHSTTVPSTHSAAPRRWHLAGPEF